jgi:hypothetical protein
VGLEEEEDKEDDKDFLWRGFAAHLGITQQMK